MSKRNAGWTSILGSKRVKNWFINPKEFIIQIQKDDFLKANCAPVKMIPTYSESELPKDLIENNIELLRNQPGGCLLIKSKQAKLPTLYPQIKDPLDRYIGQPFQPIPKLSVLTNLRSSLINEETGIHLAWSMGIIHNFLMEYFSSYDIFSLGGRIKTRVHGNFRIMGRSYSVNANVEVDGYFESNDRIVVLEAKQSNSKKKRKNFSIHQLVLPLLLVRSQTNKLCNGLFLDWFIKRGTTSSAIHFKLYLYEINGDDNYIDPFGYSLTKSKSYIISI